MPTSDAFDLDAAGEIYLAVLAELVAARPNVALPVGCAAATAGLPAWDLVLARTVHRELTRTLRGMVEDLGYDPDMLPAPPAEQRLLDLSTEIVPRVTVTIPDPDDAVTQAIKSVPGQVWDGVARRYLVPLAAPAVAGLRALVRDHGVQVSGPAAAALKELAVKIAADPGLAAVAVVSVRSDGRPAITFRIPDPGVADAFKRVQGLRWDADAGCFLAPKTRLREVLAIAATQPVSLDASVDVATQAADEPLVFDGTLDGLRGVPITDLEAVQGKRAEKFIEFGIASVLDLLLHLPLKYLDRSNLTPIRSLSEGQEVGLLATVTSINVDQRRRMVKITLADQTGKITATYFNAAWQAKRFRNGDQVTVYGKVDAWTGNGRTVLSLTNPLIDPVGDGSLPVIPIYPQSAKSRITTWEIQSAVGEALRRIPALVDPLPEEMREGLALMDRREALQTIHLPSSTEHVSAARERLAFDELFRMQLALLLMKASEQSEVGIAHTPTGKLTSALHAGLPFGLTGAQRRALAEIDVDLASPHPMHRLLQGDVGAGKAQPLDAGVLTPHGYVSMRDVRIGDQVMNPTGAVSHVVGIYPQGERQVYRVTLSDGSVVRADGEHLWAVRTSTMRSRSSEPKILTTLEILADLTEKNGAHKWHIDMIAAADMECNLPRLLDPYLLGVLLGDGSIKHDTVSISTGDAEMIDMIADAIPSESEINVSKVRNREAVHVVRINRRKLPELTETVSLDDVERLVTLYKLGYTSPQIAAAIGCSRTSVTAVLNRAGVTLRSSVPNPVKSSLQDLGLMGKGSEEKFVPEAYLVAPVSVRHAILQGLLDTDGTLDYRTGYNITFASISERLANDVVWLARSLGGRATISRRVRKSGKSWHVNVILPEEFPPFRLERKRAWVRLRTKYAFPARAITSIESDTVEEVQCIMVDHPNHLYITDNFTATHNTLVALTSMLAAVESGFQAALMAPTEILATQLYQELVERTAGLSTPEGAELRVEFFSNKLRGRKRDEALAALADGSIHIAVGTHALLVGDVTFANLGMAVIDEQHRFGVEQRALLRDKGPVQVINGEDVHIRPDMLVMTATPIPRTAAMTVFGDLDVSVLDELPPGRTPIATDWIDAEPDLEHASGDPWALVRSEVAAGRQAYVVCPLVEESEKLQAASAVETYDLLRLGALAGLTVGLVHGQQNGDERSETMRAFRAGELDVLVATTVIEVGVNVPNATVMVILDSNRFGIAQLHQLRGRVGRGVHASRCVLVGRCVSSDSRARMQALVDSTDGFYLSEVDLSLRGHGQVFGAAQSGQSDLRVADLDEDRDLLVSAREHAALLLAGDSTLSRRPALRGEIAAVLGPEAQDWLVKS